MQGHRLVNKQKKPQVGLGCVQLGLPYGNRSHEKLMDEREASDLLNFAYDQGVRFFDTAAAYGESEERIGQSGIAEKPLADISTKVPLVSEDLWRDSEGYSAFCESTVRASLAKLRLHSVRLLQFHQCDVAFLESEAFKRACSLLLEKGLADSIGVSVYHIDEARAACSYSFVSTIQLPINILDRRFASDSAKNLLQGRTVIARSVLLQGVLVETAELPRVRRMSELEAAKRLALAASQGNSMLDMAFRYIFGNLKEFLDIVLLGVTSRADLSHNLVLADRSTEPLKADELAKFDEACNFLSSKQLFHPGNWNKADS